MKNNPLLEQINLSRNERRSLFILSIIFLISCILILYADDKIVIYNKSTLDARFEIIEEKPDTTIKSDLKKNSKSKVDYAHKSKSVGKKSYDEKSNKTKIEKSADQITQLKLGTKFDPNYVIESQLLEMGINKYAARNWVKFIETGARFKAPEDLRKVYGLKTKEYTQIIDYLLFPVGEKPQTKFSMNQKKKSKQIFEINAVTANQLESLYGLGPTLSERIINFRDKLGGFYSLNQLSEVYGLPDTTINHILPHLKIQSNHTKISLNSVDYESLKKHPYISAKQAKIILRYQLQHGQFESMDELQNLKIFEDEHLDKLSQYLTI